MHACIHTFIYIYLPLYSPSAMTNDKDRDVVLYFPAWRAFQVCQPHSITIWYFNRSVYRVCLPLSITLWYFNNLLDICKLPAGRGKEKTNCPLHWRGPRPLGACSPPQSPPPQPPRGPGVGPGLWREQFFAIYPYTLSVKSNLNLYSHE